MADGQHLLAVVLRDGTREPDSLEQDSLLS